MAKRFTQKRRKKREKLKEIDNIPKYSQQRRSPAPKRRTDFSLFLFGSSSSPSSSSSSLSSNALLHQRSLLESSIDKEMLSSVTRATLDNKKRKTKDTSRLPLVRCSNKDDRQDLFSDLVETPILEVESASHTVLKGRPSSYRQLFRSPSGPNNSNEQDQSCDKRSSLGSSQTDSDFLERRRGKRTRKAKLHFDETTFPLTSARKVRRLRIMRYLGLIAPVGSPFSLTHVHV